MGINPWGGGGRCPSKTGTRTDNKTKTKMQGIKITFTEAQVAWLVANFADTKNDELCERLGCGGHKYSRR